MDDANAAKRSHGGGHVGLCDGVHGRGDAGDGKRDVAAESGGELDGLRGEVDVVGKEDDVIVGVGVTLVKEPLGGEPILAGKHGGGSAERE